MFGYKTNCIQSTGAKIQAMHAEAVRVGYETVLKHVARDELARVFPMYCWRLGCRGACRLLHLKDDFAVRYERSKYEGERCYVVIHSSIDHIFVQSVPTDYPARRAFA